MAFLDGKLGLGWRLRRLGRRIYRMTLLKKLIGWSVSYSLWPVHLITSCCGVEFAAAADPVFDAERFGVLPFTSPRQTNMLYIEGSMSYKMARAAKLVYEQMQEPKYVLSMGACSQDGGVFLYSYNLVRAHEILPVEFTVSGCPPRPEGVIRAVAYLQDKIRRGKVE